MTDCSRDEIRDLLPDLVHDQLDPAARARVEQHLAQCADCAAELQLLRTLRATAFPVPELNVDRIAAAVRGSLAPVAPAVADESVVRIADARRRRADITVEAGAERSARRGGRRGPSGWAASRWRIAAAFALLAAGAGGYALSREAGTPFPGAAPEAYVAATGRASQSAGREMEPGFDEAKSGASTVAPAPSAMTAAAGAADVAGDANGVPAAPLISGYALSELTESDMQALLQSVDDLEALPELEPHRLPLLATVMEGAL